MNEKISTITRTKEGGPLSAKPLLLSLRERILITVENIKVVSKISETSYINDEAYIMGFFFPCNCIKSANFSRRTMRALKLEVLAWSKTERVLLCFPIEQNKVGQHHCYWIQVQSLLPLEDSKTLEWQVLVRRKSVLYSRCQQLGKTADSCLKNHLPRAMINGFYSQVKEKEERKVASGLIDEKSSPGVFRGLRSVTTSG